VKKFILNLIRVSFIFLTVPAFIFIIDPYDYYDYPYKMYLDRIHLFRHFNVADWALVEVDKIDKGLKEEVKKCVIGDSRSRVLISGGYKWGWSTRICGVDLDVLDLSFGGANLDESFSFLEKEIEKLESLETIIISLPIDRLLLEDHTTNRISNSKFNAPLIGVKYLTDKNLLENIYEKRKEILEDFKKEKRENDKVIESKKDINNKIRENKNDEERWKKRNQNREIRKNIFIESQNEKKEEIKNGINKVTADNNVRASFLRKFQVGNRSLFHENLKIFMKQVSKYDGKYEVVIFIPAYDDLLYDSVINDYCDDYEYYLKILKELPFSVINLQEISNEFSFGDPVHGGFLNGSLVYKINHDSTTLPTN